MLSFTQLCLTLKPWTLSLCEELLICLSVNLNTSYNISKPNQQGKGESFSINHFKTYLIDTI